MTDDLCIELITCKTSYLKVFECNFVDVNKNEKITKYKRIGRR